jgi:hypothetical protein
MHPLTISSEAVAERWRHPRGAFASGSATSARTPDRVRSYTWPNAREISLRAGIVLDCDLASPLDLLDHKEAAISLDDACSVGVLVPGEDEETSGIAADGLVLRACRLDWLGATIPTALADDLNRSVLIALVCRAGQLFDPLVDLAEEGLVVGAAILPRIHGHAFSAIERENANPVSRSLPRGSFSRVSRSVERAAKNEATFRVANESLEEKAAELGLSEERTPYLCECEDDRCSKVIQLTREEYEAVRAHPRRFVMTPGHQEAGERVIQEERGFTVIEKHGEEGDLVADEDPRSGSA